MPLKYSFRGIFLYSLYIIKKKELTINGLLIFFKSCKKIARLLKCYLKKLFFTVYTWSLNVDVV